MCGEIGDRAVRSATFRFPDLLHQPGDIRVRTITKPCRHLPNAMPVAAVSDGSLRNASDTVIRLTLASSAMSRWETRSEEIAMRRKLKGEVCGAVRRIRGADTALGFQGMPVALAHEASG